MILNKEQFQEENSPTPGVFALRVASHSTSSLVIQICAELIPPHRELEDVAFPRGAVRSRWERSHGT